MAAGQDVKALICDTFRRFDTNGDGIISRQELSKVLSIISNNKLGDGDIDQLMGVMDTNADGLIQYEEFVNWVMQEADDPLARRPNRTSIGGGKAIDLNYKTFLPERFQVDVTSRYALDKLQLGEGGYGKVFVAKDKEYSDRRVAVKKVTKTGKKASSAELYKEIAVMKELDHPNICKLLATYEQDPHMFFIMELCEGGEVFDRIIEGGLITEKIAASIVQQVAAALAYAHGRGIAHRDIKPENVVFCSKDKNDTSVKVIDWGLAMSFLGSAMVSAVGSFTYAAPEVVLSRNVSVYTEACDLWSMGVLTYVMLCGKPPFWGTESQHLRNARAEKYPMSGSPWDTISKEGKELVRGLLKADPKNRMPIGEVVKHKWLVEADKLQGLSQAESTSILTNLKHFSNGSTFSRMCITAVARQLDHKHLKDIHKVFREMDVNGDGVLSYEEVYNGFSNIFGKDSPEAMGVKETFANLDLDGSQCIDYTEFCAAGLGQKASMQEDVIWAAFKTFDVDDSGFLDVADLKQILDVADVRDQWTPEVCEALGQELVDKVDQDGDGKVDFPEWKAMMQRCWEKHLPGQEGSAEAAKAAKPAIGVSAYELLLEVSKLPIEGAAN